MTTNSVVPSVEFAEEGIVYVSLGEPGFVEEHVNITSADESCGVTVEYHETGRVMGVYIWGLDWVFPGEGSDDPDWDGSTEDGYWL